jgi:hypothetical protein
MATRAPSAAKAEAHANPIPFEPPVTRTIAPLRFNPQLTPAAPEMSEARNIPCLFTHENRPRRKRRDLSFRRKLENVARLQERGSALTRR